MSLTKIVTFAASVDQDQAAQNVQPDLRSTLSAMLELEHKKRTQNLPLYLPHCTIKICTRFILRFNSLPDDKILHLSKLKAFSDDNLNVYQKLKFALGRVENIVGKGENAGYQHFLLFPQCFLKNSLTGSLKVGIVW